MKLSVVVPVYNEEKTLPKIIKKVLKQKEVFEIIIVDDGSSDNSTNIARSLVSPKINILCHQRNLGKGAAVISGIKVAKGDVLIIQDADLEYDPADYLKLLQPLKDGEADFVVGNRWKEYKKMSITRLGNIYLTLLLRILFGSKLKDPYSCYKAAPLKVWKSLKLTSQRFEIEAEIVAKICSLGQKVAEIPIKYYPRSYTQGKKIKLIDAFKGTGRVFKVKFNYQK